MRFTHGEEEAENLMDRLSGQSALRVIKGKNGETPLSELISFLSVIWYVVSFRVRPVYPKLRKEGKGRSAQYER